MHIFRTGMVLLLLAGPIFSYGQGTGFDSFISRISGQYKVDVAIAPELLPTLDSIRNVGAEISSIQELLYRLLNHSGITYQLIDGNKLMLRRENPAAENQGLAVLVGTVTLGNSGQPLSYATVMAVNANEACNTDENGHFILSVSDTTGDVVINYLGFKPITIPIRIALQGPVDAKLEVNKIPLEEVIVVIPYRMMAQDYTSQSTDLTGYRLITEEQLLSWNAERLITRLTAYTHFSSDRGIKIRGTQAGNSLIIMDDIPVYDPYHFYNIFSPFNGFYFSSAEVYKNNLPIEYGGRIDGLINVQSKREEPKSKLILDTDLLQTGLTTELALSPGLYITGAGRVSHTGILNHALSDSTTNNFTLPGKFKDENEWTTTQEPTSDFYDINFGLTAHPGKNTMANINFFDSRDQLDNTAVMDFETAVMNHELISVHQVYASNDLWKNLGLSAGLETMLGNKTSLQVKAFHARFNKSVNYTSVLEEVRLGETQTTSNAGLQESQLMSNGIKAFITQQTGLLSSFIAGAAVQKHNVDFTAQENKTTFLEQVQTDVESSLFGEYSSTVWDKMAWSAGSRFTHLASTGRIYFLPNLRFNYKIDEAFSFRAAYSKNLQTVRALTIEDRFGRELDYPLLSDPEAGYPVLTSDKYMVGAGYTTTYLSVDAEAYYKSVDGLARVRPLRPDPSYGNPGGPPDNYYRLFTGDGRTYGIDLTVLLKVKKVEASVLYTLSKIEERYPMLFRGDYFSPQDDRRHQVKASGAYTMGKFRLSALLTYKSKAPYLSLVRLDGGNGIGMIDYTTVQRYLPPYFSIDLGLEYSFRLFRQPAMIGFSLINATNHENISDLQHLGKITRAGGSELYITSQTELLGRTANVHFRYLID